MVCVVTVSLTRLCVTSYFLPQHYVNVFNGNSQWVMVFFSQVDLTSWRSHIHTHSPLLLSTAVWLNLNKQIIQWAFLTFQQPHRGDCKHTCACAADGDTRKHTHHTLYFNTHTLIQSDIWLFCLSLPLSLSSLSLSIFSLIRDVPPFPQ